MFPIYKNNLKEEIQLTTFQKSAIKALLKSIENNKLNLIKNNCLCCNEFPQKDVIISEKDRYGIPVKNVICSKCGLIRNKTIFDEKSNIDFYKNYYREIYVGSSVANEEFFNEQEFRGREFLSLVKKHIGLNNVKKILEIGCGSGGILFPFYLKGANCSGIDFNENYLIFGKDKGLDLIYGDYKTEIPNESADLLILSHVMEHFVDPIQEMLSVIKKVKTNKYLLIEVPGIFNINKIYFNPIHYFQNAHIFNYFYDYLKIFFQRLGLEVLYGNEKCVFLLRKSESTQKSDINCIYDNSLVSYPKKVEKFILKTHFQHKFFLNRYEWKNKIRKVINSLKPQDKKRYDC